MKSLLILLIILVSPSVWSIRCPKVYGKRVEDLSTLHMLTERLEIRQLRPEEFDQGLAVWLNREVTEQSGETITRDQVVDLYRMSQTDLAAAKQALHDNSGQLFVFQLGVFLEGKVIGVVTFREYHRDWMPRIIDDSFRALRDEIIGLREKWVSYGLLLLPEYQGKGYGKEITRRRIKFAFETLEADGIIVDMHPSNAASIALSKSFGFKPVGLKVPWDPGVNEFYYLKRQESSL